MAFVLTVRNIDHQDVDSSVNVSDQFHDEGPREWTNQGLKTFELATESYMVEAIAESHFSK